MKTDMDTKKKADDLVDEWVRKNMKDHILQVDLKDKPKGLNRNRIKSVYISEKYIKR